VRYLALIAFGQEEPPRFPSTMKIPFPVLALPSWQAEDLQATLGNGPALEAAS
jgi:hypothetical protein